MFFDADPGSGIFLTLIRDGKIRIRDKHPGSATLTKFKPIIDFLNLLSILFILRFLGNLSEKRL